MIPLRSNPIIIAKTPLGAVPAIDQPAADGRGHPRFSRHLNNMSPDASDADVPLIGSPYDLRVSLGAQVSESDIRVALESGESGFVHSFTAGSTVDGPGRRIVAWLSGCQFRCLYCHNPDTWKLTNGMPVTLARAVEVVQEYRPSLVQGGLTISGGEPLLQQRFVINLLESARNLCLHTAIGTNGYFGARLSDAELGLIDLVLLDIKALSCDLHRRLTGYDNQPILDFARRLAALRKPVWVRFVFVPVVTDDLDEIDHLANFVAGLGNVERVEVLPFHQIGRFKWEKLGMDYELRQTDPPSRAKIEKAITRFCAKGLKAS
jgi:pyruvate formate lyase activating enzyme